MEPEGDFFLSNSALVYATERPMGPVQLRGMLCFPYRFPALGLPTWTRYESEIISFMLLRGRGRDCSWTALRGGQETVGKSLAHELLIHRSNVARALARLKRMQLVGVEVGDKGRETVSLTERMHLLATEAQWRFLLYDTNSDHVVALAKTPGWQIVLVTIDRWFQRNRSKRQSSWDDRRAALSKVETTTTL